MKPASAVLLLAAAVLSGCAARTTHPAERGKSSAFAPATERPGLGTSWGEQRESWVEPARFARANPERPAVRGQIYYNDREGADAMLAFLGGEAKRSDGPQPVSGGLVRAGLRGENGAWLDCREARGKRIAAGERGTRYEVILKNDARRAVEVVVSVDGLDATDGKPASLTKRGYVLAPFETLAVEGFRTSRTTVAAFRFGRMFDTYGQRRHGTAVNAGVVGIAVFEEKRGASPAAAGDHAWRATASRPGGGAHGFASPPEV